MMLDAGVNAMQNHRSPKATGAARRVIEARQAMTTMNPIATRPANSRVSYQTGSSSMSVSAVSPIGAKNNRT